MSSPRSRPNGSSATKSAARKTASPRPRGLDCLTYMIRAAFINASRSSRAPGRLDFARYSSSSKFASKWSSIARLLRPVTMRISRIPLATASSTTNWIAGLSTIGIISFGMAFVYGRNRVPNPAAGMTAFIESPNRRT